MAIALKRAEVHGSVMDAVIALFTWRRSQRATVRGQAIPLTYDASADGKELFDKLLLWEQNRLSDAETLAFFQELVNTGLAWRSTGAVRRMASMLIRDGQIHWDLSSEKHT